MPASVGTSRARTLETGEAKLWALLVGVNYYSDDRFPTLAYSALDCQGLAEALTAATRTFPQKSVLVHHDFAPLAAGELPSNNRSLPDQVAVARRIGLGTVAKLRNFPASAPKLNSVQASLHRIVQAAKPQDTVLFYFSGHGVLDAATQQAVLCLSDTNRDNLTQTGLGVQDVLQLLNHCAAHQQIVWLDACHSGGMTLRSGLRPSTRQPELPNPTPQLVEMLQQQAARSQGFYALLSCDQNQLSWEFPELGHGVFTYYLMRGLLGEAADAQGMIEADALYKYVYYQTLRYIDKTNQQLRLINQQKRGRGQIQLQPEYPQQTPKRIVEGIGELIIGIKPETTASRYPRQALVVEGLAANPATLAVSKILRSEGSFELTYFPQPNKDWTTLQTAIQICLQSGSQAPSIEELSHSATVLLYLRGQTKITPSGDACLVLRQTEISRSWLRQELRRSPVAQQVVILDCPNADTLEDWIEDLQIGTGRGQCLIAVASPADNPDWFANTLHETLSAAEPQAGLPIAGWIAQIQIHAAAAGITPQIWLSGTQGVIEILPGKIGTKGSSDAAFDLGICPYLGLRAFSEDDAPFFFGRETLTQQLIHVLMQQSFLAVVGASGSGKSSVVQAGLMAQIRQGKQIPGSEQWWMQNLRPGERPLFALAQCLATHETERLQIEGILYQGVEGFVYWLRARSEPMVLLLVDQFEELFTLAPTEDRQRFLDLVLGAIQHAGDRFKLVITLRSDFVASSLENPALARLLQQSSLLVPPVLNEEDYRQVILRPAEKVGLAVEPELIEVLLQELSHSAGDLPLLEFVLEQLWEHRRPGTLSLETYQQKIGGLKGALERKAQAVYDSLDPDAQACARWIFLSLTQLGETTEDTRRRVIKANLIVKKYPASLVDRTLQALTAAKLVVVSVAVEPAEHQSRNAADQPPSHLPPSPIPPPPTSVTIEVAHEILIRHWSTLRWWLEENRSRLRAERQIEQAAHQWQQSRQQTDFLLRGVRLDAAEELYVKYTDELSEEVQSFIEAGLTERDREQKQLRRRLRQAQVAVMLIGTLGLSAAGFGGFAYLQRQRALINEISTLNALSESQFLAHQQLESLTTSFQAAKRLQRIFWLGVDAKTQARIKLQTVATMQQAVEETQERNRLGHPQQVNSVAVNADGTQIVSGSDDGTVRLWQVNGTLVEQLTIAGRATAVAFSPNGQQIAASSNDGSVTLWNPAANTKTTLQSGDWVTGLAFSSNGEFLATANRDQTIKLWNLTNPTSPRTLTAHQGFVNAVQFSPDDRTIASAGEDGKVILWDISKNTLIKTLNGHQGRATSIAFSPNGEMLASTGEDQTIRLWTIGSGQARVWKAHEKQVNSIQFSRDGQRLISASADQTLKLWNVADAAFLAGLNGHGDAILSATFAPDGRTIISGGADKTMRVWNVAFRIPNRSSQIDADISAFSISPTRQMATATWDGQIRWYQEISEPSVRTWKAHQHTISVLNFSPDGQRLLSGSDDQTLKLWDRNGRLLHTLTGHQAKVASASFSPDGKWIASVGEDKTVRLWNAGNGELIRVLEGHQDGVSSVAWHPNGQILATGSYDNTIKLWKQNGILIRTLREHRLAVAAVAFSPDGNLLASASWDNTIKLWNVTQETPPETLTGHQDGVTSLSFTSNGILISASADRTLKLWHQDGSLIKTLIGQPDPILSLNLSSDSKKLFTLSASGIHTLNFDLSDLEQQGCEYINAYLQVSLNKAVKEVLCPKE